MLALAWQNRGNDINFYKFTPFKWCEFTPKTHCVRCGYFAFAQYDGKGLALAFVDCHDFANAKSRNDEILQKIHGFVKIKVKIQAFLTPKFTNLLKITAKIQGFVKSLNFPLNLNQRCSISSEKSLLANEARLEANAVWRSLLKAIYRPKTNQAEFKKAHKKSIKFTKKRH